MAEIFLGEPPANIKQFIIQKYGGGGSTPATRTATRVWYGDDPNVYTDYEIIGAIEGEMAAAPTVQITNVRSAKKIEIGSTVTSIGDFAFYSCAGLMNVIIGDNVENIGESAFEGCGMSTLIIPSKVTNISVGAFMDITNLNSITFIGKTMQQVQDIEDGQGNKYYPWDISDTSIIHVA